MQRRSVSVRGMTIRQVPLLTGSNHHGLSVSESDLKRNLLHGLAAHSALGEYNRKVIEPEERLSPSLRGHGTLVGAAWIQDTNVFVLQVYPKLYIVECILFS